MPFLIQLVAMWVAKDIAAGKYPTKIAVPLSFLVSRVGAPGLLVGALGLALQAFRSGAATMENNPSPPRTATANKRRRS